MKVKERVRDSSPPIVEHHEDEDETAQPGETPNQRWRRLANARGRNLFAAMDRMATLSASHHEYTAEEMEVLIAVCELKLGQMIKKLRNGGEDIFS